MALTRSAALLFVTRAGSAALTVVSYIVFAHRSNASVFAAAGSAVAVASFLAVVVDFGGSSAVLRGGGRAVEINEVVTVRDRQHSLLIASLVLYVAFSAGLGTLDLPLVLGVGAYAGIYPIELQAVSFLLSQGNVSAASWVTVWEKLVCLLSVVVLPVGGMVSGLVMAQAVGALAAWVLARALYRSPTATRLLGGFKPRLRSDTVTNWSPLWTATGALSVQAMSLELPICTAFSGGLTASTLVIPSRLTVPLGLLAGTVSSLVTVEESSTDRRGSTYSLGRVTILVVGATAVSALVVGVWAHQLLRIIVPSSYPLSVGPLRIALASSVIGAASQPLGGAIFARGGERRLGALLLGSTVLGLLVAALGSIVGGANGAAIGRLAMSTVVLVGSVLIWASLKERQS